MYKQLLTVTLYSNYNFKLIIKNKIRFYTLNFLTTSCGTSKDCLIFCFEFSKKIKKFGENLRYAHKVKTLLK